MSCQTHSDKVAKPLNFISSGALFFPPTNDTLHFWVGFVSQPPSPCLQSGQFLTRLCYSSSFLDCICMHAMFQHRLLPWLFSSPQIKAKLCLPTKPSMAWPQPASPSTAAPSQGLHAAAMRKHHPACVSSPKKMATQLVFIEHLLCTKHPPKNFFSG